MTNTQLRHYTMLVNTEASLSRSSTLDAFNAVADEQALNDDDRCALFDALGLDRKSVV